MAELIDVHVCRACGKPVLRGAMLCSHCGEPLAAPLGSVRALTTVTPFPPAIIRTRTLVLALPDHRTLPLVEGESIELGRDTERPEVNSALAPYTDTSRHHAVVELLDGVVVLTAIPGNLGTIVESDTVTGTVTIGVGSRIRLGDYCWLQVRET